MAPSNVFSYLRPHHKRTNSHPSSPEPPLSASSITSPADLFASPPPPPHRLPLDSTSSHSNSPRSPFPPVLPPIPRIASRTEPPEPQRQAPPPARRPAGNNGELTTPEPDSVLSPESWRDAGRRPGTGSGNHAPTGLRAKGQRVEHTWPAEAATVWPSPYMSQSSLVPAGSSDRHAQAVKPAAPVQHGKSAKRGLNLLNPMSLLLRRRSAQVLQDLSDESLVTHRNQVVHPMSLADDFDPSIRGKIVHDFSAPKPKRAQSHDVNDDESPSKRDRSHTPVFKEEFDGIDADDEKRKSAIRAETLANHDFLARNAVPEPDRGPLAPPFGRNPAPPHLARRSIPPPLSQVPIRDDAAAGLATVPEASPSPPADIVMRHLSNAKTPPQSRSRATSGASFQGAGLPTHMTSRASRFSFQIAGVDSAAQEKLLEEKHRQKAAAKAQERAGADDARDYMDDEEEDMYDYDDMDDQFAGFEEEIPTIGADDYGYDQFNGLTYSTGLSPGLAAFDFNSINSKAPFNSTLTTISATGESIATPTEPQGNVIGSAPSPDSLQQAQRPSPLGMSMYGNPQLGTDFQGFGLMGVGAGNNGIDEEDLSPESSSDRAQEEAAADKPQKPQDDDDMYFDDGLIGEPDPPDGERFDESVFDDPNHPLYERPAPAPKPLPTQSVELVPGDVDDDVDQENERSESKHGLVPHPSMRIHTRGFRADDPFDFNDPSDYFSALAEAANKAEAEGRFVRKHSVAITRPSLYSQEGGDGRNDESRTTVRDSQETAPSLVPDSGRVSGVTEIFFPNALNDFGDLGRTFGEDPYEDGFGDDYDSVLEDDPIIAAANAEALANDFDGEYGTEFGFYASAYGESEAVNGGYFGPRGVDALGRSVSGRYAVREPNLTPITERSEYSTRNSFIGLGHFPGPGGQPTSAGALPSPGLAQLARMSPFGFQMGSEDDYSDYDISFEQLMKLRKGAFGGAGTVSPGGSAESSPRNSSPMSYLPGNFSGRGSSPVATRAKSALDAYSEGLQEVEESPNEASAEETPELETGSPEEDGDEALVQEVNGADVASDLSGGSEYTDEEVDDLEQSNPTITGPAAAAAAHNNTNGPISSQTNYDVFLPDHPSRIPISVPASAISNASTSSLPFSPSLGQPSTSSASASGIYSPPGAANALAAPPPLLSPTSPQMQQFPYPSLEPQKHHHQQPPLLPPLSPCTNCGGIPLSPSSSALSDHYSHPQPHRKTGHSRAGSGAADSVTYVRERIDSADGEGGGGDGDGGAGTGTGAAAAAGGGGGGAEYRWVLERRRASETGELELVGREVVEGGRI